MSAALQFSGISKHFPGVKALDDVSFSVEAGAVHGLMGENGAGKSTLLKILGGQYVPNAGQILIDGQPRQFRSAREAIAAGIAIIHQELQYVPDMTVADNLLLGHYPARFGFVRRGAALATVRAALQRIGVDIDPLARLRQLSIAQRQMVEICKAVMRDARIIAFDEPTSSLSHRETEILFRLVRRLQADGHALIYISHRMDEIYALCDSCTIFRDGRKVASHAVLADVGRDTMIREMVGRDIADIYNYQPRPLGPVRLSVQGMEGPGLTAPADFAVRGGEILGFFGLVGAGRSELMRLVAGVTSHSGGALELDGAAVHIGNVRQAIRQGIVFCPEDRKEEGIVGGLSVSENINISCRRHDRRWGFFVNDRKEAATAERFIDLLKIKTPSRRQEIRFLSGGNQQKAILSRWLAEVGVKVLIVDEPTRGIDVGAKNDIYKVLYALAEQGCAIIMISSELPEVLGVADRVMVMRQGRIVGELSHAEGDQDKLLQLALPVADAGAEPRHEAHAATPIH